MTDNPEAVAIERALLAMRRSQSRRSLMKRALDRPGDQALDSTIFDVLDLIEAGRDEGRAVGVREIAIGLNVDQPRASRLVARAVAEGYVRREADQADGRRTLLAATASGAAVVERAHRFRRGEVAAAVADWSAADRRAFAELFARFVTAMGSRRPTD